LADAPRSPLEKVFVAAGWAYVAASVLLQTPGLLDREILEWDARAFTLPAFRYHHTGLFPGDLVVDAMARYDTPAHHAIYWLGTLVTDPIEISKLLPFALFALLAWQGYALGRARGGRVLGVACVIVLAHCSFVWNRLAGGNPRAFGFPLVVTFLRYAAEGASRRSLAVLIAQALAYPSALLCCAPVAVVLGLRRGRGPLLRALAASGLGALLAGAALWGDPRLGPPPTYAEAATLRVLHADSAQPYYPLPSFATLLRRELPLPFRADGDTWRGISVAGWLGLILLTLALVVAARALRRRGERLAGDTWAFVLLPLAGLVMAAVAQALAYRFYLPQRMLQLAWLPTALVALPLLLEYVLRSGPRASLRAGLIACAVLFGLGGDGLALAENLTDFRRHLTPIIRQVATLPPEVLIATHPERASYVQLFASRRALISASTNMPFLVGYAREIERRTEAFFRAYYARDLEGVRRLRKEHGVDYLLVDRRDFGEDARTRARYYEPWGSLNQALLTSVEPDALALAHPPKEAILFSAGTHLLLDLRRLDESPR
jgi:hypothetical protein